MLSYRCYFIVLWMTIVFSAKIQSEYNFYIRIEYLDNWFWKTISVRILSIAGLPICSFIRSEGGIDWQIHIVSYRGLQMRLIQLIMRCQPITHGPRPVVQPNTTITQLLSSLITTIIRLRAQRWPLETPWDCTHCITTSNFWLEWIRVNLGCAVTIQSLTAPTKCE